MGKRVVVDTRPHAVDTPRMTGFIRPEARKVLFRLRELLAAGALAALGLYWALTSYGVLAWLGWIILAAAALVFVAFLQRVWFGAGDGGLGHVEVLEGQISYFAPEGGGFVAIRELSEVLYDPRGKAHWVLHQPQMPELRIPTAASGAEELFDAFTSLEGLSAERLLTAQRRAKDQATDQAVVIWQREAKLAIDSAPTKLHS